ncbi:MAG: hypothetical protein J5I65_16365 [Aridibacter famidurans]|nr:hypothetical protein [Aridibacter famidurans]
MGLLIRHSSKRRRAAVRSKSVYFDLHDPRLERYLYWLLKIFDRAGWTVFLKASPWLLLNLRNCSDYIYDCSKLRLVIAAPRDAELTIHHGRRNGSGLRLRTDYFSENKGPHHFNIPFSMHPDIYHRSMDLSLEALRQGERKVCVFMGGNLGDVYGSELMKERFGLCNRAELTNAFERSFSADREYLELKTEIDAERIFSGEVRPQYVMMKSAFLSLESWMRILATSRFFVAPPGLIMPFSHNIIEAMSVGTIPITEYGHLFDPQLQRGTCFRFSGIREFPEVVSAAAALDKRESDAISRSVEDYYSRYLDPAAVVNRLDKRRDEISSVFLVSGHLSVRDKS